MLRHHTLTPGRSPRHSYNTPSRGSGAARSPLIAARSAGLTRGSAAGEYKSRGRWCDSLPTRRRCFVVGVDRDDLIERIPTPALDAGQNFDSFRTVAHRRITRRKPRSSLRSHVRFKWGPLHHVLATRCWYGNKIICQSDKIVLLAVRRGHAILLKSPTLAEINNSLRVATKGAGHSYVSVVANGSGKVAMNQQSDQSGANDVEHVSNRTAWPKIAGLIVSALAIVPLLLLISNRSLTSGVRDASAGTADNSDSLNGSTVQPTTETPSPPDETRWHCHENVDQFTNATFGYGEVRSENAIELKFPYEGAQYATLVYQADKDSRGNVSPSLRLFVPHGQFLCSSIDPCNVDVRIDENHFDLWTAYQPKDGRANILEFGSLFNRFSGRFVCLVVAEIAAAKTLTIRAPFYDNPAQVFVFNVQGLKSLPLPVLDEPHISRHCPESGAAVIRGKNS